MDRIFGFPRAGLHSAANNVALMVAEASAESTTVEVATRLFPDDEFSLLPGFVDTASAYYGAAIQPVDTGDAAAAAETINRWVSETTRGLIPALVSEKVVEDQRLVLANTVYLKADWVYPFLPDGEGRFTTLGRSQDDGMEPEVESLREVKATDLSHSSPPAEVGW